MNEDITFCSADCANLECERNKAHIKEPIFHSFADFSDEDRCREYRLATEKVVQASDGKVSVIVSVGAEANPDYKEILKLDERLTASEIPHVIERSLDGWIVVYPSFEDRVGDAIQHRMSYGAKNDLLEVYGFGLKEPIGWIDTDKAFTIFKEAHEKGMAQKRKRNERKNKGGKCNGSKAN